MAEPSTTDATVELPEDGIVTIDVTDNPDLAAEAAEEEVAPAPKPRPAAAAKQSAVDEAATALKAEADRRAAAEATAETERRRADDATRLAARHQQEALGYREQAESQELTIINSGIESATKEIAAHQAELERAMEAGEFPAASAAQVKLAKAAAALDRLESEKNSFEAGSRKVPTAEGRVEAPGATAPSAFEQYVSQPSIAPVAQAWLRAHPDCVPATVGGNATRNAKMMGGHYAAIAQGIPTNTPEYFRTIEEAIGERAPVSAAATVVAAGSDEGAAPAPKPRQKAPQPAAPVSRDPPAGSGAPRTVRSVTLTKDQQDAAKMSFPHLPPAQALAQYARNLVELEAEGKLGRTTH